MVLHLDICLNFIATNPPCCNVVSCDTGTGSGTVVETVITLWEVKGATCCGTRGRAAHDLVLVYQGFFLPQYTYNYNNMNGLNKNINYILTFMSVRCIKFGTSEISKYCDVINSYLVHVPLTEISNHILMYKQLRYNNCITSNCNTEYIRAV